MRTLPKWWLSPSWLSFVLAPLSFVYQCVGWLRSIINKPHQFDVPVLCIGNVVVGGAGKTPLAISLVQMIQRDYGKKACFLTKGYQGSLKGPLVVDIAKHNASEVGDEALLLAKHATTIMAKDRKAAHELINQQHCDIVLLDDGLQNPTIKKTTSLLVVDGTVGYGNGWVMPSGPLRESVYSAFKKISLVVIMGAKNANIPTYATPVVRANVELDKSLALPKGKLVAFAGIGRPQKFYDTLQAAGGTIVFTKDFPDHHSFKEHELLALKTEAQAHGATMITTEKDWVRLPLIWQKEVAYTKVDVVIETLEPVKNILTNLLGSAINPQEKSVT